MQLRDALIGWLTPGTLPPDLFGPDLRALLGGLQRPWAAPVANDDGAAAEGEQKSQAFRPGCDTACFP